MEKVAGPTAPKAEELLKAAGISGERGLVAHEVTAVGREKRGLLTEMAGDSIPGFDQLRSGTMYIVVSERQIRVFKLRRFGRFGECLATVPAEPTALSYNDKHLLFADGTAFSLTRFQAQDLIVACGGDYHVARASCALRALGVQDEVALGTSAGIVPGSSRKTVGGMLGDAIAGDGGFKSRTSEGRIVLFTDKFVRLLPGEDIASLGQPLSSLPIGTDLPVEADILTFPGGNKVQFTSSKLAQRVADMALHGWPTS